MRSVVRRFLTLLPMLAAFAASAELAAQTAAPPQSELGRALAALEHYAPQQQAPTGTEVTAAYERLEKALPQLVADKDPTAARLRTLVGQRGDALAPSRERKVHARDPLTRLLVRFVDEALQHEPVDAVRAHAGAADFPGAVPADATPVFRVFRLDLAVPGRHSLGLYAAPGARVLARTAATELPEGLRLRIGAHSDNIARRDAWPRLPRITRTFAFDRAEVAAACAFGGLVYVEVPKGQRGELPLEVSGAVPAPLFVLGDTEVSAWHVYGRNAPGPWAELATDKVVLTVPSSLVRTLDDPTAVLQFWNQVLDGAAVLAARPLTRDRAERYVADLEISAGAMHSGYPIMTHLNAGADMVDIERMRRGPWGLFHELGHNHQQKAWTFGGTGEVTVNLFSLYLCETLCGLDIDRAWGGNVQRSKQRLARHVRDGTPPWDGDDGKADLSLRLLMYSQLQKEFGWAAFTKVFADYLALSATEQPQTDEQRRDEWLVRFSRQVGRDLGPFFVAWGLPTSEAARASLVDLRVWMPADWPRR